MALRDFTDEEMQLLARVIKREQQALHNIPSRPSQDRSFDENQDWLAPEVYIAKPREEIPALEAGTGTGLRSKDLPGYAQADIYRVVLDDDGNPRLVKSFEQNRRLLNLTESSISQEEYLTVLRDKYGSWLAQISGKPRLPVEILGYSTTGTGTGTGTFDAYEPLAYHRGNAITAPVLCRELDEDWVPTGDPFEVYSHLLAGVVTNGSRLEAAYINNNWELIGSGTHFWARASTVTACTVVGGTCNVELLGPTGRNPIVQAYSPWILDPDHPVQVNFDDWWLEYWITAPDCPPIPVLTDTGTGS